MRKIGSRPEKLQSFRIGRLLKICRLAPARAFLQGCNGWSSCPHHAEGDDADLRINGFFHRATAVLPPGGILIFDIIECGEPSLTGRFWSSGDDWAVLVDTVEYPAARTLVRDIQTFRRVGDLYRRGREVHRVRLFDSGRLRDELAACGFAIETARQYGADMLAPRRRAFFTGRLGPA